MKQKGFTLIELTFAIAIMGILAAMLIPKTGNMFTWEKQQADQTYVEDLGQRFVEGVVASRTIPDNTTWAVFLSKYANASPANVTTNKFNKKRIYVFPDNFFAAGSTLPFDQTANNAASIFLNAVPANPRVMIISDTSKGNTQIVTNSGVMAAATFDAIWVQNVASPSFIAELKEGDGLKISRINLNSIFKDVTINNNDAANSANITVNGQPAGMYAVPTLSTFHAWLIKNSQLFLYDNAGVLAYQHTVSEPVSFVYNGGWGGNLGGAGGGGTGGAGGGGTSQALGSGFNSANNGLFTNWGPNPTCSPTGTVYQLTVDAKNANEDYLVYAGIGGNATYLGKVKKGKKMNYNVSECELVFIVPKGNNSTQIYAFYMPHNNYTMVIP